MTITDDFANTLAASVPSANASYGELCDFYNANKDSVEKMKDNIETLQNNISALGRQINERDMKIANAKAAILEAFDNESFDRENMEVIADALEIELTKEYQVTINVTFSGTVTLPLGIDVDEIENYVNFEANESGWGTDDIEVDLFTDGVDVNVIER
jgi:hypothetical protein